MAATVQSPRCPPPPRAREPASGASLRRSGGRRAGGEAMGPAGEWEGAWKDAGGGGVGVGGSWRLTDRRRPRVRPRGPGGWAQPLRMTYDAALSLTFLGAPHRAGRHSIASWPLLPAAATGACVLLSGPKHHHSPRGEGHYRLCRDRGGEPPVPPARPPATAGGSAQTGRGPRHPPPGRVGGAAAVASVVACVTARRAASERARRPGVRWVSLDSAGTRFSVCFLYA